MTAPTVAVARPAAPGSGVLRVVVTKVLTAIVVLFFVATAAFLLVRLSGDPVKLILPPDATAAQEATLRASLGLDRPLLTQYLDYLGGLPRLHLGTSLVYDQPVSEVLFSRRPRDAGAGRRRAARGPRDRGPGGHRSPRCAAAVRATPA